MAQRVLQLHRTDGLGARLTALVHVMRFATELQADVRMHWRSLCWLERDAHADDWRFSDLFDRTLSDLRQVTICDVAGEAAPDAPILDQDPLRQNSLRFGFRPDEIPFAEGAVVLAGSRILRLQGESDEKVVADLRAAFLRLVPTTSIRVALAQADELLSDKATVGVHVRRGDVLSSTRAAIQLLDGASLDGADSKHVRSMVRAFALRGAPVEAVCSALSELAEGKKVVVLGEAPAIQARIEESVGRERVVDFSGIRAKLTPIRAALFDLYLFTRMTVIIGGSSAFTRLAVETGLSRMHCVEPSGSALPWLTMFNEEILDGSSIAAETAAVARDLFREEVGVIASRTDRLAERAAMLAKHAQRAKLKQ